MIAEDGENRIGNCGGAVEGVAVRQDSMVRPFRDPSRNRAFDLIGGAVVSPRC